MTCDLRGTASRVINRDEHAMASGLHFGLMLSLQ